MSLNVAAPAPGMTKRGWPSRWLLARWRRVVRNIRSIESQLETLNDQQLAERSTALHHEALFQDRSLGRLLPEAYALVSECIFRQLKLRSYDVQLIGAIAMHHGYIAEMQAGEGKTLAATLPIYLHAMSNRGVHVATANDYLAQRDAEHLRPVYESLGLRVGFVRSQMSRPERKRAYACHITYGTAKEFGFDYLRDRLLQRQAHVSTIDSLRSGGSRPSLNQDSSPVQRRARFALIDEADSILIDEATTPLIIAGAPQDPDATEAVCFKWCAAICSQFIENQHFRYIEATKKVELTTDGQQLTSERERPPALASMALKELHEAVERAIRVRRDFVRDRHYIVGDGQVVIVDENTGRLGIGRHWQNGIHQAVEAKEGLAITAATTRQVQITLQEFFSQYSRLAGMTGTAYNSRRELRCVYGLPVVRIPTHRPSRRVHLPEQVYQYADDKWTAIVDEVSQLHKQGRPVLVGTRSIDKSEHLSRMLAQAGIDHEVLNAKQDADEARIVAKAGQLGKITLATNIAGRGTDIHLGDGVAEIGGLHVVCTELHDSCRIDRQLVGRCARQDDPGSVRQYLSLEDEILDNGLGTARANRLRKRVPEDKAAVQSSSPWFYAAQDEIEKKRFETRRSLMRLCQHRAEQAGKDGL